METPAAETSARPKRARTTFRVARWLFPRLLALVYLAAFWSWGVQYDGLVGKDGILPTEEYLKAINEAWDAKGVGGVERFFQFPTLFLWHYSDGFGKGVCWAGAMLALLAMAGVFQGPLLLALCFLYLSVATTGNVFMSFQWDSLLVETGFVGALLAPWRWWTGRIPAKRPDGAWAAVFALHFLLFKLMFMSGYVKPASGHETWIHSTAVAVHYETQPLPTVLGWWAHQLPLGMHKACCWVMYFIELVLPFAIFCGRWGRLAACAGFSALMAVILLTGNYTYFNYLTLFLALTLLDDSWWPQRVKRWLRRPDFARERRRWPVQAALIPICAGYVFFSIISMAADTWRRGRPEFRPAWAQSLAKKIDGWLPQEDESAWHNKANEYLATLRLVNSYGLFADMTTDRFELILEVSRDGAEWLEVPFRAKPGDPMQRPEFVAPHQPRLDWQFWFAAFTDTLDYRSFWALRFSEALLRHKKPVWDLLGPPPIPIAEVRYLRFLRYRYGFTSIQTRKETGRWWNRELQEAWTQSLSLRN